MPTGWRDSHACLKEATFVGDCRVELPALAKKNR